MSKEDSNDNIETVTKDNVLSCLGGDIVMFMDTPYPDLVKGTVQVFKAQRDNAFGDDLIAYVCDRALTPRHLIEAKFSKIVNPNLLKLFATDVVDWPEGGRKYAYFYEGSVKQPISLDDAPALGWKPDDVMNNIVNPILSVLIELRNKDLVHGEIWPGNMLLDHSQANTQVILGECLSLPQSSNLPFIYEPVGRALADPVGRGAGELADDLYAFGVSLAMILRTSDPMEGASKEEIIAHKIEKGTYGTLIGKDRFNGAILELLRGLLYDDPAQRWTLDDILEWRDGRRLSPKQSTKRVKASRPIDFKGIKYTRPELLAVDLYQKPEDVNQLIESGDMAQWIDRAIEDKTIKMRVEQLLNNLKTTDRSSFYNDQVTAMLGVTLYPEAPISFKGHRFHLSGFGKVLTHGYLMKSDTKPFTQIIKSGFLLQAMQNVKVIPALSMLRTRFDSCRTLLSQTLLGSGFERCLYALNPECHCLSPALEKYYVRSPEDMMEVFEILCKEDPNIVLFDRHIVAFLSLKDRKNVDSYLPDLRAREGHRRILGQLRILATIQKRYNMKEFPYIAAWIASNLNQVYEQFYDNVKKKKLKDKVEELKTSGDLLKISTLFDDPNMYQVDLNYFLQIKRYYKVLAQEKMEIKKRLAKNVIGFETGSQIASLISLLLAMLIIVISIYMNFVGR